MLRYKLFVGIATCAFFFLGGLHHISAQSALAQPLPQVNKNFQVAVSVVMSEGGNPVIDQSTITNIITAASAYFSPIGVSFTVCEYDTIFNTRYDTLRDDQENELFTEYAKRNRMNVFVVGGFETSACGKGSLEGISKVDAQLSNTGVVVSSNCGIGTMVHEIGHFFGLPHTFAPDDSKSTELADGSNCETAGDGICDTPADPYIVDTKQSVYLDTIKTCLFIYEETDANGDYYSPDIGNIMSYYNCFSCGSSGFTDGQYRKMAETYFTNKVAW